MFSETKEGTTRILVPKQPTKSIFYNPKMELCRDIDIAGVAAFVSLGNQKASLRTGVKRIPATPISLIMVFPQQFLLVFFQAALLPHLQFGWLYLS